MSPENLAELIVNVADADRVDTDRPPESYVNELKPRPSRSPLPTVPELPRLPALPPLVEADASAASRLVRGLVEAGVETFFGVPGGPISPVFDAILHTPGARLIESRHETSAAFAAADYYRASGRVPAVVVTAGPGATNVVTGVVSAHLERIPLLLICGDVAWAADGGRCGSGASWSRSPMCRRRPG